MLDSEKGTQMNDWQFSNQFFTEGRIHYESGGSVKDCPYNYMDVDQEDERQIQNELYRQKEWLAGFHFQHKESLLQLKTA
jgi:hypothetical protein